MTALVIPAALLTLVGSAIAVTATIRQQRLERSLLKLLETGNPDSIHLAEFMQENRATYLRGLTLSQLRVSWFGWGMVLIGHGVFVVDVFIAPYFGG